MTDGEKSRRVSILTVTFNHAEEIDACLDAALAQAADGLEVEVVMVDNASSDGTPDRVAARGDVELIEAGETSASPRRRISRALERERGLTPPSSSRGKVRRRGREGRPARCEPAP